MTNRFLVIFSVSFATYFILDYVFKSVMLYIMGGAIGGSISAIFKAFGARAGIIPIILIWMVILIGVVFLFYRIENKPAKYFVAFLIAALLYVVDIAIGEIATVINNPEEIKNISLYNTIGIGLTVIIKSLILSWIIYTGINKS